MERGWVCGFVSGALGEALEFTWSKRCRIRSGTRWKIPFTQTCQSAPVESPKKNQVNLYLKIHHHESIYLPTKVINDTINIPLSPSIPIHQPPQIQYNLMPLHYRQHQELFTHNFFILAKARYPDPNIRQFASLRSAGSSSYDNWI